MNTVMKGVGAIILAAAFASTSPGLLQAQEADRPADETVVAETKSTAEMFVENHGWSDVHLYMVRGSQRRSIGFLTALGSGKFELPAAASMPGEYVHILVNPIGGAPYVTSPIVVNPGETYRLVVQNHLPLSSVSTLPST